jgi:hypothetical protein
MSKRVYKNWAKLCDLRREDPLLMMVLATIDERKMEFTDPRTEQIIAAFPEYFSETETAKVYPLSFIRELTVRTILAESSEARGRSAKDLERFPESFGILKKLNIPFVELANGTDSMIADEAPLVPETIPADVLQGTVVEWEKRTMVVLENNQNSQVDIMVLVPAECVDVNT